MPHPSAVATTGTVGQGWGRHGWGKSWGGATSAGFVIGGQVVRRRRGWARGERLQGTLSGTKVVKL